MGLVPNGRLSPVTHPMTGAVPRPPAAHKVPHLPRVRALMLAAALALPWPATLAAEPVHALAMHGQPKHPAGFTHFPYVNPDAPRGGRLVLGRQGSFDSLNAFIDKGESALGLR